MLASVATRPVRRSLGTSGSMQGLGGGTLPWRRCGRTWSARAAKSTLTSRHHAPARQGAVAVVRRSSREGVREAATVA